MNDHNEFYILNIYRPTLQATVFCRRVEQAVNQPCQSSVGATAWLLLPGGCQRPVTSSSRLPAPRDHLELETRPPSQEHKGDEAGEAKETNQTARQCPGFPASTISGQQDHPADSRLLLYRHDCRSCSSAPQALQSHHDQCWKQLCCQGTTSPARWGNLFHNTQETPWPKSVPDQSCIFLETVVWCSLQLQLSLRHSYHPDFFCWTTFLPRRAVKKIGTAAQLQMSGHSSSSKTSMSCLPTTAEESQGWALPQTQLPGSSTHIWQVTPNPDWDCWPAIKQAMHHFHTTLIPSLAVLLLDILQIHFGTLSREHTQVVESRLWTDSLQIHCSTHLILN